MQFTTKNSHQFYVDISYANKLIYKAHDTKFLGIYLDSRLGKFILNKLQTNYTC